jgi:hypothetical protein
MKVNRSINKLKQTHLLFTFTASILGCIAIWFLLFASAASTLCQRSCIACIRGCSRLMRREGPDTVLVTTDKGLPYLAGPVRVARDDAMDCQQIPFRVLIAGHIADKAEQN